MTSTTSNIPFWPCLPTLPRKMTCQPGTTTAIQTFWPVCCFLCPWLYWKWFGMGCHCQAFMVRIWPNYLAFKSQLHSFLIVWPWPSNLTALGLSFLICKCNHNNRNYFIRLNIRINLFTYWIYICVYMGAFVCRHTHRCVSTYIYIYVCVCMCMYIHIHTHMYLRKLA